MDCCGSKKDDTLDSRKNDETITKNAKQENTHEEHSYGGCCGGNPWAMVVMVILMAVILYLTYKR